MVLDRYIRVFRTQWTVVLVSVWLSAAAAGVWASTGEPTYTATTQMLVALPGVGDDIEGTYAAARFAQRRARTYAKIVSGPAGAQAVINRLGLPESVPDVQRRIRVTLRPQAVLIDATATAHTPTQAVAMANALRDYIMGLPRQLEGGDRRAPPALAATVTRAARLPTHPVAPRTTIYVALGALLGLVAGVAAAVALDARTGRVRT